MAKRGPKPTPPAVKKAAKNPGKRPPKKAAAPPAAPIAPPAWLDGPALDHWKRLAPLADARGLLHDLDAEAFARYCHLIDVFLTARAEAAAGGAVVYTETGNPIQNPAYGLMNSAARDLSKLDAAFGLTPAARTGLTVEPDKTDDLAAFIL